MTRRNLFSFMFDELTISRRITDTMWSFSITIDKNYDSPNLWEPVEATLEHEGVQYCLFIGFPISKKKIIVRGDEYWDIKGVSYGWYLPNTPLRPAERLLQTTKSGNTIIVEDPITYMNRIMYPGNVAITGLIKGTWDTSTIGWGTASMPGMQFEMNESATIQSAFDEIADYTGLIHYDYWKKVGPDWRAVSYLVNEANIDTKLDLPAPLVITHSDNQIDARTLKMIEDIQATEEGDNWKNRVVVDAKIQGSNTSYTAWMPSTWDIATNGLERRYQYCEELPPGTSAAQALSWANNRASTIYSLLCTPTINFDVPFWYNFNLKLWQKIKFDGFPNINPGQMRVVEINYRFNDSDGAVCNISCALERNWASARKLALILKLDQSALRDTIEKIIDKKSRATFLATVTGVSGSSAIYESVSGRAGYAATPNQ